MAKLATWSQYRSSIGDRSGLFAALADAWPIEHALYPGSYVDLAPSTALPSVTYVDTDQRAAKFFAAQDRVRDELTGRSRPGAGREVRFLQADYTQPLAVSAGSMDMLISLYAGPVWENCRQYLRTVPGCWPTPATGTPAWLRWSPRCAWSRPCTSAIAATSWSPTDSSSTWSPRTGPGDPGDHPVHWLRHRLHATCFRLRLPDLLKRRPGLGLDHPVDDRSAGHSGVRRASATTRSDQVIDLVDR